MPGRGECRRYGGGALDCMYAVECGAALGQLAVILPVKLTVSDNKSAADVNRLSRDPACRRRTQE